MRQLLLLGILATALVLLACNTGRSGADMTDELASLEKEVEDLEQEYSRTLEEREELENELENTRELYEETRSALARRDQLRSELEAMGYSPTEAEVVAGVVARGEEPDTTVAPSKETPPAKPAREAAWRGRGGRYTGPHRIHVVVRGEYLYEIAGYGKYFGNRERWPLIYEVNAYQIKDPHWIFIGQRLQVPTP